MNIRWTKIALAAILILGLFLRLLYLAEIVPHPGFTRPGIDPAYYDYWARAMISGDWSVPFPTTDPEIPDHPYFKPPGYPLLLSLFYRVSSGSYLFPRIVQMLLGLAAAFLAYLIARKRLGERTALIWSGLMAGYWIFIHYEGELLESAPVIILFLSIFGLLLRWSDSPSPLTAAGAGLLLGATALMRPNFLALPLAIIPWMFLSGPPVVRRRVFHSAGAFLLAILIPIIPVTIRNYKVSGDFVPIATYGGINLHLGNQHNSTPILTHGSPITGDWSSFDYPKIVRRLEKEEGRPLTHAQSASLLTGRGWDWIRSHPALFFRRLKDKALLFWGPREVANNKEVEYERLHSPVLSRLPGSFALVLALGIIGALLWQLEARNEPPHSPRRRPLTLLAGLAAVYFLTFLPFVAAALYRVPIIPFLLLAGAVGIDRFLYCLRRRAGKTAALIAGGFVLLYLLARLNPSGYQPRLERWYYDQAVDFGEAGRDAEAREYYRRAIGEKADFAYAYNNRGNLLRKGKEFREAIADYSRAIRSRPDYGEAYNNRGLAYLEGLRDFPRALADFKRALELDPENAAAWYNRGNLFLARGEPQSAIAEYNRSLSLNPRYSMAYNNRGNARAEIGRLEEARGDYDRALSYDPENAEAYYNRAKLFLTAGDYHAAADGIGRALKLKPDFPEAQLNLGVARHLLGETEAALEAFRRAIELKPEYAEAFYNLGIVLESGGRTEEARRAYDRALRLDPQNADFRYRRDLLPTNNVTK